MKEKNKKLYLNQSKLLWNTLLKNKRISHWNKLFAKDTSDHGLTYKIYKELWNSNDQKKKKKQLEDGQKYLNRDLTKENILLANKLWKNAQYHLS